MLHRYTVASVCGVHEGRFLAYLHKKCCENRFAWGWEGVIEKGGGVVVEWNNADC